MTPTNPAAPSFQLTRAQEVYIAKRWLSWLPIMEIAANRAGHPHRERNGFLQMAAGRHRERVTTCLAHKLLWRTIRDYALDDPRMDHALFLAAVADAVRRMEHRNLGRLRKHRHEKETSTP